MQNAATLTASARIALHHRLNDELLRFVDLNRFTHPAAVTLTMKKRVGGQPNDIITASRNVGHFLNRLNHGLLGSAAKKHGRRLRLFGVLECSADDRLHWHGTIDRPPHKSFTEFKARIAELWAKTDFGYHETDVQDCANEGWHQYLFKRRQKRGAVLDHIDWMNCSLTAG